MFKITLRIIQRSLRAYTELDGLSGLLVTRAFIKHAKSYLCSNCRLLIDEHGRHPSIVFTDN
jgi:hypothetical protein